MLLERAVSKADGRVHILLSRAFPFTQYQNVFRPSRMCKDSSQTSWYITRSIIAHEIRSPNLLIGLPTPRTNQQLEVDRDRHHRRPQHLSGLWLALASKSSNNESMRSLLIGLSFLRLTIPGLFGFLLKTLA